LVLAFSQEDPGAAARLFKNFSKDNKALEVRHLALSGQLLGADQLDRVAKLPTYDQAIAMLMSVMKAPITKLVRTMAEPTAKMVRTFAALKDVK
jgi:large subunit ribosomal protein L10